MRIDKETSSKIPYLVENYGGINSLRIIDENFADAERE
jgi:hypothetical protein